MDDVGFELGRLLVLGIEMVVYVWVVLENLVEVGICKGPFVDLDEWDRIFVDEAAEYYGKLVAQVPIFSLEEVMEQALNFVCNKYLFLLDNTGVLLSKSLVSAPVLWVQADPLIQLEILEDLNHCDHRLSVF